MFLTFILLFGRATDFTPCNILNLYVFLSSREDVPHSGDFMLHQVFVEGLRDLQPTDKRNDSHVVIAIIHQRHLALEVTDVIIEALSGLHLDRGKVIDVILKLQSRSIFVIEGQLHLFETPE